MTTTGIGYSTRRDWSWLAGNARLIDRCGQLLGAHIAHAGLMMFWAGSVTLLEVSQIDRDRAIAEQGLLLIPNLARLGWGVGAQGTITDTYPYFVIGVLHLVASAVLGAGGLFHVFRGAAILKNGEGRSPKFHYDWNDGKQLSLILGHHLIFLGIAAFLLVAKAMFWGGIYDPVGENVRLITSPNINPVTIFGYLFGLVDGIWNPLGMAAVNNLETVIGGHIWIGAICIGGGIWHIVREPLSWANKALTFNAHGILSYSLAGVALMAFTSCYFVAFNDTVYPTALYGSDHAQFVAVQFALCITFLGGHIWHALKARAEGNQLGDRDKFSAFMAGFLTLTILAIGLVLISFS